ncbi:MAG: autotransporter adhesin family protein [Treponema sp.]|nr:autotransporter adhesin family protein [Treponema sp.]
MKKNAGMYLRILLIVLPVCAVCACFSPWTGDDCTLAINLTGKAANNARLINPGDIPGYIHTVTLTGSGVSIQEKFPGTSHVLKAAPGKYFLTVKANLVGKDDFGGTFVGDLTAWAGQEITLKPGLNTPVDLTMISASEVSNYSDLQNVINSISDYQIKEEIIIIKNDILTPDEISSLTDDIGYVDINFLSISGFNVTLMAESNVTINFPPLLGINMGLFRVDTGLLTLGMEGMSGSITIDGGGNPSPGQGLYSYPLINIGGGGTVVMNSKVILQNNNTNAVNIVGSRDNSGQLIPENSGTFIMDGGAISGNTSMELCGGVYNNGYFTMNGGTISGNTATSYGGAVCNYGSFTMNDGTISGNTSASFGGGVYNDGSIILAGGKITGNRAESGGGIYSETAIDAGKTTVSGNTGGDIVIGDTEKPVEPLTITLETSPVDISNIGTITQIPTAALPGSTITFTVAPINPATQVTPVVYQTDDATQVDLTPLNNNTYSFVMPNSSVTISVEFI